MSGRPRHRISHPFHSVPPGRFHTSSSRTPSPSTSRSPPRGRVNSHLQSQIFDSISTTLGTPARPRIRQRRASNMPGFSSNLAPHRSGEQSDGREIVHKEYNLTNFEWSIYELQHLIKHVEECQPSIWALASEQEQPESLPEVLKRGVIIGDGWYKLEIARSLPTGHSPYSTLDQIAEDSRAEMPEIKSLTLYVGALYLENQAIDINYPADIFVGLRPIERNIGRKHAETKWLWEHKGAYEFTRDREFYEIALPDLKAFLENPIVKENDALSLCIQIGSSPSVKPIFNLPKEVAMPTNLIHGLASLLDSPTGDVKFVCLEQAPRDGDEHGNAGMFRKRVLYAHSEILKARCEYFHDLLDGGFSESEARRTDSRHTTILVDDAGFDTVYWLLRFIYTNQLEFAPKEDIRGLMKRLSIDKAEINKVLTSASAYSGLGEWDYRSLSEGDDLSDVLDHTDFDMRTVSSVGTSASRRDETRGRDRAGSSSASTTSAASTSSASSSTKAISSLSNHTSSSATPTQRQVSSATPKRAAAPPAIRPATVQPRVQGATASSSTSPQKGNRTTYPIRLQPEADPHTHPCTQPQPASALAVYMLAHRYRLVDLEVMAKEQILASLRSDNCMPVLFATYPYSSLHEEILEYIVDCWGSVRHDPEFFKCIQEVSSGIWGETGGLVIHGLFSKL